MIQLFPYTPKDDIVRPGKRISPRQAMEAAKAAVRAGQNNPVIIRTTYDAELQKRMLALNVGSH